MDLNEIKPVPDQKGAKDALAYDPERDVHEIAKEFHCEAEIANPWTLQLDLDNGTEKFYEMKNLLEELGIITSSLKGELRPSRGGNQHAIIKLPFPLSPELRILLQCLLGSDLKREALNLARVYIGATNPIILFKPKTTPAMKANEVKDDLPF